MYPFHYFYVVPTATLGTAFETAAVPSPCQSRFQLYLVRHMRGAAFETGLSSQLIDSPTNILFSLQICGLRFVFLINQDLPGATKEVKQPTPAQHGKVA